MTQTHRMAMGTILSGGLAQQRRTGIPHVKKWDATIDGKTRPDHADANGQVVPLSEAFMVGGEQLMFPGDPSGSPQQTINCRCTMIIEARPLVR